VYPARCEIEDSDIRKLLAELSRNVNDLVYTYVR
jgi:hypothetical protein